MTSKADSLDKPRFLDGQEPPLTFTTPPANDARADRKVGFQHHHNLFVPSLSAMNSFSSHTLNSGTSFGSLDDLMDDQQLQGAAASMNILDPEYPTNAVLTSSATYGDPRLARLSPREQLEPSIADDSTRLNGRCLFTNLPTAVLGRIFAIAATNCYDTRSQIPLVCRKFHHMAMVECPEMWDTFELLTGNLGALSSRRQVEYVLSKSRDVDLHIGFGIASSRLGTWDPSESNVGENEDPEWPSSPQRNATHMVHFVASFMPRVVSLVVDVHDVSLDPELDRALHSLFDDQRTIELKRLTMMGTYHLNRIRTPHQPTAWTTQSLSNLRHLWIAYSANFRLVAPMPQVATLFMSMVPEESAPNTSSLEQTLSNFPNLTRLEILGTVPTPSMSTNDSQSTWAAMMRDDVVARPKFNSLRHLVLERLSLTCSFLSTMLVPNIEHMEIRDFELGFDPRDVRYDTTLLSRHARRDSHLEGTARSGQQLAPLPFGRFLLNNSKSGTLRSLMLEKLPDMVVRMCVEFVRIVGSPINTAPSHSSLDVEKRVGGLERLVLADSKWPDWEPLFNPKDHLIPLPHLKHLEVQIEHYPGLRAVGGVTTRPEVSLERQEWMDGLTRLAEWRMGHDAVTKMLRDWNIAVPSWLLQSGGGAVRRPADDEAEQPGDGGTLIARTLEGISLATGYVDTYPFLHAAWLALQREHRLEETPRSE